MSQRVTTTLESMVPAIDIYSIDEAFVQLGALWAGDSDEFGHQIRATIQQYTALTVGVGIGPKKPWPNWLTTPRRNGPPQVVSLTSEIKYAEPG